MRAMGALKVMGYDKKVMVLKHDPIIPSEAAGQLGVETGAIVQALPYTIAGQPVIAFVAGGGMIREDMKAGTVDYVLTRPVRRPVVVLARFVSQLVCLQVIHLVVLTALMFGEI